MLAEISARMHDIDPDMGVDTLLTHPLEAMALALDVARQTERITPAEWNAATAALGIFRLQLGHVADAINDVCRAAMNGRKRGKIKPSGTSPAIRAAATRKGAQQS